MKLDEVLGTARDAITVRRVFADPYERDGVTIIAAAAVSGGGGGGGAAGNDGEDDDAQPSQGGGFGVSARPAGAFVVKNGSVRWRSAVDLNRLVAAVGAVAAIYLITRARVARARARS